MSQHSALIYWPSQVSGEEGHPDGCMAGGGRGGL